jgi:2-amino-4-hydroxy-6-hydroxymethyldihydropteridine diphosphokinase
VEECAYIALGSNLGDRELKLLTAVAELGTLPETRVTALSPFYETEPVGEVAQDPFYNAVARLVTRLAPRELLAELKRIETQVFLRKKTVHWGPRTMDLDILFYGDLVYTAADLTIPHPHLAERRFVLQPLADIAPNLVHPSLGKSIAELLAALTTTEKVVRI